MLDDRPAILLRLIIKLLRKRAHFWNQAIPAPDRTRIRACASSCNTSMESRAPWPALVYSSICRSPVEFPNDGIRPTANHHVDAFRFAGVVVIQQKFGILGQDGLAGFIITVTHAAHGTDNLLRRDAIRLLAIHAHKILSAAGDDIGFITISPEDVAGPPASAGTSNQCKAGPIDGFWPQPAIESLRPGIDPLSCP